MFKIPLGDLVVRLLGDSSKFEKMVSKAQAKIAAAGKKLEAVGRKMTLAITAPLLAIGAMSVKSFASFDDAMTKSLSIMGDVSEGMRKRMEEVALAISRKSVTPAEELAKAYFYLASAGMDAEQSMAALSSVEKFAVAGAFDMARATDLLTDAQTALGLSTEDPQQNLKEMIRLSDVLVRANSLANTSVEQVSEALTNKFGTALRLMNKSVEEGVAVLAVFADAGPKGVVAGEQAVIAMRDLQRAVIAQPKLWKEFGLQVFDASEKMLPMADIIEGLENKFGSMTDKQKRASISMLGFQDRSFSALQTLFGASEKIRAYEKALNSAGGETERVANRQLKSFSAQMKIFWNNLEGVRIEIGRELAPHLKALAEWITSLTVKWRSFTPEMKKFVIYAAAAAAAIGPILWGLGALIGIVGALSVKMLVMSAAILVIPAALVLATDALLQFFDKGNLGVLDLINSFRIGELKVSTHVQIMTIKVMKLWETMWFHLEKGLDTFLFEWKNVFGLMWRAVLHSGKKIAEGFWKFLDLLTGGAWEKEFQELIRKSNATYKADINESLTAREMRFRKHYGALGKLEKNYREDQKKWDKTIKDLMKKDVREGAKEKQEAKDLFKLKLPEIPEIPEIKMPEIKELGKTLEPIGSFQQISLRRFELEGKGGLSGGRQKKQKVEDEGVVKAVNNLNQTMEQQSNVAVLG